MCKSTVEGVDATDSGLVLSNFDVVFALLDIETVCTVLASDVSKVDGTFALSDSH